jgi:3-hydroxyacyl-[acyl-carrier-protein] dehydratase
LRAWNAIDLVLAMDRGKAARGIRNVPATLDVFDSHFERFPVLPGVLVLGSLAELARLLMKETTGADYRLRAARRVRFRGYVRPGDQMDLSVSIDSLDEATAELRGTVKVGDQVVVTATSLTLAQAGTAS